LRRTKHAPGLEGKEGGIDQGVGPALIPLSCVARAQLVVSCERLPKPREANMPKVKPIPDGYPQLTPYVCVDNAAKAIEFYQKVFGAKERMRMPGPDGKIGHAELQIGDSVLMLSDEAPDFGALSPRTVGGTPVTLSLYVEDVDTVFKKALASGSKQLRALENQFYGDRSGQFEDPFGHKWSVATHVEDVSEEEMTRRAAEMGG
jgi:PhnB protein